MAPETAGSGYDIHMFFHCHSNGDENPAPPPQKAGYGYPPEVSGSVHRKIFSRGSWIRYQTPPHFQERALLHLYGWHRWSRSFPQAAHLRYRLKRPEW